MGTQTVGNNTTGDESTAGYEGYVVASKFTAPADGGGTCTFYAYMDGTSATYPSIATGVWADNGSDYPGDLLATGPVLTPGANPGWVSGTFTWTGITSGTTYWIGALGQSIAGAGLLYDTASAGASRVRTNTNYPTLPDPFTASGTTGNRSFCLYVEYTDTATGTPIPVFMNQYRQRWN